MILVTICQLTLHSMRKLFTTLIGLTGFIGLSTSAFAQFEDPFASGNDLAGELGDAGPQESTSEIIVSANSIKAGETFKVALKLSHPPKWHSYYFNDGIGISQVPAIKWTLPAGFTASALTFPAPHEMDSFGLNSYGYEGVNYFITTITAPADLKAGSNLSFTADASWQICKVNCTQEKASYNFSVKSADTTVINAAYATELGDYVAKHVPTFVVPDSLKVGAKDENGTITLTFVSDNKLPADLHFYEYDRQLDAQKPIKIKVTDKTATITGARNKGNDFSDEVPPTREFIRGILYSASTPLSGDNHAIFISSKWGAPAKAESATMEIIKDVVKPEAKTGSDNAVVSPKAISLDGTTETKYTLLTVIPFALLGGLILNIMPCVFPVLGLKITGFAQQAGEDKSKIKIHGMVFALGILVSMWILAGALIVLKSLGDDVGWGFQLQNPVLLSIILIVMFAMGLNLCGLFEIGTSMTSVGGDLQMKKGYSGSFFSGLLTTIIATPCSAPIVAPVMGFATNLSPLPALFVFTLFGLGIAAPFLILSFMPKLIQKLPKPGAWMVTFKKIMAFPMFAAVIFFLGGYMSITGQTGGMWLLTAFLTYTIALFIFGHWGVPYKPKATRYKSFAISILFMIAGIWMTVNSVNSQPDKSTGGALTTADGFIWEKWTPEKVAQYRAEGKTVYVDFTADT